MKRWQRPRGKNITLVVGAVIILLLVLICFLFFKYRSLQHANDVASHNSPEAISARVIQEVSKLYEVPSDEAPTVIQVKDTAQLKDKPFFAKAQNGDYTLVYTQHKLGILYREKSNKLINVSPITVQDSQGVAGAQSSRVPTVGILNASGDTVKAASTADKIKTLGDQVTVLGTTTAKNKNTSKTIVVDTTAQHAALAQRIADTIGASIQSALPSGESVPQGSADIVVIVGKN